MKTKEIIAPTSLPLTLDEVKAYYRVIGNSEDAVIIRTITAATEKAEQITNSQLQTATYEGYLDSFQSVVTLPKPPLVSVTKVEYTDTDGLTQEWTDYVVDDVAVPAVIYFDSFPSDVETDGVNNVVITFECGYTTVPSAITSWMLIYGLTMFENRENVAINVSVDESLTAHYNHLLDSYRIIPV